MAEFNPAFAKLIEMEGDFIDHPDDPGGATNLGISLRWLQSTGDHDLGDIDGDGDIDYEDIRAMTIVDARKLYKEHWWDKYHYDALPDQAIANKIFDMAVNMGARQAHKLLQRAINSVMGKIALKDDGLLGPQSGQALQVALQNPPALLSAMRAQQEGFYRLLAVQNPKLSTFLKGWINRAVS